MTFPVFGGHVFSDVAPLRPGQRSVRFRAKKVFLDSWATGIVRGDACHTASFVQNRLNDIRNDDCDGLIMIPGHRTRAEWIKQIEEEACRMELTVLVPIPLTHDFLRNVQTVIPIVYEEGTFQSCDRITANEGGFLLLNGENHVFGLVLYEASRCLWTGFTSSDARIVQNGIVQDGAWCEQDSKLTAARWLDFTRQSFSQSFTGRGIADSCYPPAIPLSPG